MTTLTSNRTAGYLGIAAAVAIIVGFIGIAGFTPAIDATPEEFRQYLAGVSVARVYVGEYLESLGFVLFVFFASRTAQWAVTDRPADGWLAQAAFGSAILTTGLALVAIGALAPLVHRAEDLPLELAQTVNDVRVAIRWGSLMATAGFLSACGVLLLKRRPQRRMLGWGGIVVAVVVLAGLAAPTGGIADLGSMLFLLWVTAAGVALIRSPATADMPATNTSPVTST